MRINLEHFGEKVMKTLVAALVLSALATAPAFAHAHLESSIPADGSTVTAPTSLTLTFSEGLELAFSGATVTGPAGAVLLQPATLDPADPEVLVVPLDTPLPPGSYTVDWHALASDGHKTTGSYSFTVQ
jgi:methionine-rich copper-binding protein CopC